MVDFPEPGIPSISINFVSVPISLLHHFYPELYGRVSNSPARIILSSIPAKAGIYW
jgi:hypothetical protein